MARDKRTPRGPDEPQSEQEEMTFIVMKFKGGSQTLQKGFDAVTQAISALGARTHHSVVQRQPQQLPPTDGKVVDAEAHHLPEEPAADDSAEEAPVSGDGKAKKSSSASKHTFLNEFNLSPPDGLSLEAYCTGKDPQTDRDRFLVVCSWIQTHGATNPFTGDHLFTCFRAMNWKTQGDMVQHLRQMKLEKSYYENPSRGQWRVTTIGLQAAENIKKE
jgi:hypothetical protein